ncbi:sigma-70 family RNA polymerase sigma factor [Sorangium atrum]|uniref:Sigma-70 family RNA polymerase sigma factor n=1 Tax=Sorangium atrum TaxID=2995308 RepID=A0ABT5BW50_9BACT|nr:sigma-70 family RNA polymerase sigma factor [Sorangium aterium]MDC0677648.1 sigma-70 family RNA polymerase sigma factor [Sorangium aterium]
MLALLRGAPRRPRALERRAPGSAQRGMSILKCPTRPLGNYAGMRKSSRTPDTAADQPPLTIEAIMAEHLDHVRRYVERQGFRGADRDDLVQEIFLGASRSLPRYDPRLASVRTWLLRIAFNHISNERKRAHRRHEEPWPEEALDGLSSPAPDSETRLIEAQQRELLADLLLEVPPVRREILVAHDLEEEAVQEIAEERAMPRNTAWNHLRLARQSLVAAARRWRARSRGALIAPLAIAFGALEARAASRPLHAGRLRRLLDRACRAFRRAPARGEAGPAASSWRRPLLARRAGRRSVASTATGGVAAVAGALVLLVPGPRGEGPLPQAHAVALRSPAAAAERRGALPSDPELRPEEPPAGAVSGALEALRPDATPPRAPHSLPRRDAAVSMPEDRLMRQAFAALTSGEYGAVRLLLEQHRRDFPKGSYAGDREVLLQRLRAAARRD